MLTCPRSLAVVAALALGAHVPPGRAADTLRSPHELTIIARDYAFEAPASVAAGLTTVRLENKGPDLHHVQLLHLLEGKSAHDALTALGTTSPLPAWIVFAGGPNASAPGTSATTTLDLAPGRYLIVCFVDTPNHVPHMARGMTRELTVVASRALPATPPTPDATLALRDYTFSLSPLSAGRHVIQVTNDGAQPHEALLVRFPPGKSMKDLLAWGESLQGPAPALPLGGVTSMMKGQTQYVHVDLAPGHYGLICFVPDAKDGKPHLAHGMTKEFEVK